MQHFGMSVLVIVPTYNEFENIRQIASAVRDRGYDLLIVDDGSPDGTGEIADQLAVDDPKIHVLHRTVKEGLGPAYAAGFTKGLEIGAEIICEMDADFSHDPSDLPRLVAAVENGADLAIGSRYIDGGKVDGWPWHRQFISKAGNLYARTMLGISTRDSTAGFRAFRDTTIRKLDPSTCQASGYGFQIEMAWRAEAAGLDVVEVPITFKDRTLGDSKMNRSIAIEAIALVTKWGFRRIFGRSPAPV